MGKCDSCYLFAANESMFSIAKRLDLHARRNQILLQTQPCSDAHCKYSKHEYIGKRRYSKNPQLRTYIFRS